MYIKKNISRKAEFEGSEITYKYKQRYNHKTRDFVLTCARYIFTKNYGNGSVPSMASMFCLRRNLRRNHCF